MKLLLAFLLFCSFPLFSEEKKLDRSAAVDKASVQAILDARYIINAQPTPYFITPKVDVVSGAYMEDAEDLRVAGIEALSFKRFHNSFSTDSRFGYWNYVPESFAVASFEYKELFVAYGERDGSIKSFENRRAALSNGFLCGEHFFDPIKQKGWTSFNGQTNPLNTKIHYKRKDEKSFNYYGTIIDGTGTLRTFTTLDYNWTSILKIPAYYYVWVVDHYTKIETDIELSPSFWTPYQLLLMEERLPNGNVICYSYAPWLNEQYFPQFRLIKTVKAYNANKTKLLASFEIDYQNFKVIGSDKREAAFGFVKNPVLLTHAASPPQPLLSYQYSGTKLCQISKPKGLYLKTEYDASGKVKALYAPVGPKGEIGAISRYVYHEKSTDVFDGENHLTTYHFDNDKRITKIQAHDRIEKYEWDPKTGNLLTKSIENAAGKTFLKTTFTYDANHNPIEETNGDGIESYTVYREYSKDGFNLKTREWDDFGKETRFSYKPQTNLLVLELTLDHQQICKRAFHRYDDCASKIETIVDDGQSDDPNDLRNVTYRRITSISPKKAMPCLGLPESVEEKTIDKQGNQILLKKIVYSYHPSGSIKQEDHYDAQNVFRYSIKNEYDQNERLKKTTDPLGLETSFAYDENFNLISSKGPRSHKQWEYDKADRPICEKTNGLTIRKKYDRMGQVVEIIDECQNSTRFTYDPLGRITMILHPDGGIEKKEYDPLGNLIKETDPNGYETKKVFNFRNQVTQVEYPDGSNETFTYEPNGHLKEHADKNGKVTIYTNDIFGRPIKTEVYEKGKPLKVTSSTYSPFCKLSETNELGVTATYAYDFAGRKIAEKFGEKEISYLYDELGRLTKTKTGSTLFIEAFDLLGYLTEKRTEDLSGKIIFKENYLYDEEGNRTHTLTCGGTEETKYNAQNLPLSTKAPDGHVTTFSYLYDKNFTKTTIDPLGVQTFEVFDACKRLKEFQVKNPSGHLIQHREFLHDKAGNKIQTTEHVYDGVMFKYSVTNRWEYGPHGRVEKMIEPQGKTTSYFYDEKGRLERTVKPNGVELIHTYDSLGRLHRLRSNQGDIDYIYTYDLLDRVSSVNGLSRTYDIYGNLTMEKWENGPKISCTYDPYGKKVALFLPNGTSIQYTYLANQLSQVTYRDLVYSYKERNLASKPTTLVLPKNLGTIQLDYDSCLRIKDIRSPFFSSLNHEYDSNGNLLNYKLIDPLGSLDASFTYDDLSQLSSEKEHTYSHDSLYNRLNHNESRCTLNDLSQVTHDGKHSYQYDANGNLVATSSTRFTYDSLDRLIKVQKNGLTFEYTYDAFNRRILKKTPDKTICYLWDDKNEIGTTNGELRILGEGLGAEIGSACFVQLNSTIYIPIHDHRGSLATLLNLKGEPVVTYRYTAFGEELFQNPLSPWRFLSKRTDEETNFIYFGQRYYNPSLGRWLTPDPLGFEDGPNLYAYVYNCPLTAIDLYGEWTSFQDFGRQAFDFAFPCTSALYHLPANAPLWKRGALAFGSVGETALLLFPPARFGASLAEKTITQLSKSVLSRSSSKTSQMANRSLGRYGAKSEFNEFENSIANNLTKKTNFISDINGTTIPTSKAVLEEGFRKAGFKSFETRAEGMAYILPNCIVRVMHPSGRAPLRASFTNFKHGHISPFTGKPVQPPRGLHQKERLNFVRENTHIELQP